MIVKKMDNEKICVIQLLVLCIHPMYSMCLLFFKTLQFFLKEYRSYVFKKTFNNLWD